MSSRRCELRNFEWSIIEVPLPNMSRGVPHVDDRQGLIGIYRRLRRGPAWADGLKLNGSPTTSYDRIFKLVRHWCLGSTACGGCGGLGGARCD
jgi:transposase